MFSQEACSFLSCRDALLISIILDLIFGTWFSGDYLESLWLRFCQTNSLRNLILTKNHQSINFLTLNLVTHEIRNIQSCENWVLGDAFGESLSDSNS